MSRDRAGRQGLLYSCRGCGLLLRVRESVQGARSRIWPSAVHLHGSPGLPPLGSEADDRARMATINKRGRAWQLTWSDADGQHRISLGPVPKKEADIKRREKELELLTGRRYGLTGLPFEQFTVEYLAWYSMQFPSSYARVESIIRLQLIPHFGLLDLDSITIPDETHFIARRRRQVKPATVTKEVRVLHAMLNKAVQWRRIELHPLRGSSPPPERASKPPEFYTHEQLEALYAVAGSYKEAWRFMANTGLRRNEALFLPLADVLSDRVIVRSSEDRPTKSRQWREVRLNAPARAAVEALRAARGKDEQMYLFPRLTPRSLSRAFEKAAVRAGLPGSLHTLRHTFISHMVMAGVDLPTVQKIAGHSTIATTLKYSHLAPGHAQAAVEKIAL